VVKLLIEGTADMNQVDARGWSPMHWAAQSGRAAAMQELLRSRALVTSLDNVGSAPLHWAAHEGTIDVVKALLDNKADALLLNQAGLAPLDLARNHTSSIEHMKVVDWLTKHAKQLGQSMGIEPSAIAAAAAAAANADSTVPEDGVEMFDVLEAQAQLKKTSAANMRAIVELEAKLKKRQTELDSETRAVSAMAWRLQSHHEALHLVEEAKIEIPHMEEELKWNKQACRAAQEQLFAMAEGSEQEKEMALNKALSTERRECERLQQALAFETKLKEQAMRTVSELTELGMAF